MEYNDYDELCMHKSFSKKSTMITQLFAESAKIYPDRPAISIESEVQTYAELAAAARISATKKPLSLIMVRVERIELSF